MITDSVKVPESEVEQAKYSKENGILGLMDCGGSNLVKINEQIPGIVRIIGTGRGPDHPECKARQRKEEMQVPFAEIDFRTEEEKRGVAAGDYFKALQLVELNKQLKSADRAYKSYLEAQIMAVSKKIKADLIPRDIIAAREEVCSEFLKKIHVEMDKKGIPRNIPVFAAGFMQLLSEKFIKSFDILNVHPGDLTKYDIKGVKRTYKRSIVGDAWKPPAKAISAGHDTLYSSMHFMINEMDKGPVCMRGYGLPIDYNYLLSRVDISDEKIIKQVGSAAQDVLKHIGDHVVAGATFQDLFDDNWGRHKSTGVLTYRFNGEWYLAPNGITIEDHIANNPQTVFKRDKDFLEAKIKEFYVEVDKICKGEVE